MKQSKLSALEKFRAEIVAQVTNLEAAVQAGGNVSPAVEEALGNLKTSLQSVDDLNPDPVA
jgi:hypothetical protein